MSLTIHQLALASLSKGDLAILQNNSEARAERTGAIGIDFYRHEDRAKPFEKARFCVARFEWRCGTWRRVNKHSGPRKLGEIQDDLERIAKRLALPIIDQA